MHYPYGRGIVHRIIVEHRLHRPPPDLSLRATGRVFPRELPVGSGIGSEALGELGRDRAGRRHRRKPRSLY